MAIYYDILSNYLGDPFDGDKITFFKQVRSAKCGGTFLDLTVPSQPNFPQEAPGGGDKQRYFVQLPMIPDLTEADIGQTRPFILKDFTDSPQGTVLSRVTEVPSQIYEYRVAPATSKRPHIVEFSHFQAGHIIGFDYYGTGSILQAEYINNINQEQIMKKQLIFMADYFNYKNFITGDTNTNPNGVGQFTLPEGYSNILDIVLIGGGGGGGGGASDNANGNAGQDGGYSQFGNLIVPGGAKGSGGTYNGAAAALGGFTGKYKDATYTGWFQKNSVNGAISGFGSGSNGGISSTAAGAGANGAIGNYRPGGAGGAQTGSDSSYYPGESAGTTAYGCGGGGGGGGRYNTASDGKGGYAGFLPGEGGTGGGAGGTTGGTSSGGGGGGGQGGGILALDGYVGSSSISYQIGIGGTGGAQQTSHYGGGGAGGSGTCGLLYVYGYRL